VSPWWQNLIVLALVAAAGVYLARLVWQSLARRKAAACGGCSGCAQKTASTGANSPMVSLDHLRSLDADGGIPHGGS
jgi:hypothetical protein